MRQPWRQQKQQPEGPEIASMNQQQPKTHNSQKPRNRQVAANPTKLRYVNGTCLSEMDVRETLHLSYCRASSNLPTHCDGCGAKFFIAHRFEYKVVYVVIQRHEEIKFELQDLAARAAIITSVVRDAW